MNTPSSQSIQTLMLLVGSLVVGCLLAPASFSQESGSPDDKKSESDSGKIPMYLEYTAGVSFVPNQNLTRGSSSSAGYSGSVQTNPGYSFTAAFGADVFKFMDGDLRTEVALGYRNAEVDSMNVGGPDITPQEVSDASGDLSLFTAMLNGYVDYDFGIVVIPYLGAGIGYGRIELEAQNSGSQLKITDAASVFVWNLMAGLSYPYSEVVDLTGGYRYIATDDFDYEARILGLGGRRLQSQYDAHEVRLGIRIKF